MDICRRATDVDYDDVTDVLREQLGRAQDRLGCGHHDGVRKLGALTESFALDDVVDKCFGDRRARRFDLETPDLRHDIRDDVDASAVAAQDLADPLGDPFVARDHEVRVERIGADRLGIVQDHPLLAAVRAATEQHDLGLNIVEPAAGIRA